jgi:hypothetical protein
MSERGAATPGWLDVKPHDTHNQESRLVRRVKAVTVILVLVFTASSAGAWTLHLDIDTDLDPSTLTLSTNDVEADLVLQLWPDVSGESISEIEFGLGISCVQCGGPENIVVLIECGLLQSGQDWLDHPAFQTAWHDVATCIDCCDEETGV